MTSHKNAGGIAVNILTFGSNGHITKPKGGVLENYTRCATSSWGGNYSIKTICDPLKTYFASTHHCLYYRGFFSLNEDGGIVRGTIAKEIHFSKIRINHYFTKSKEEYYAKRNRGKADRLDIRPMSDFDSYDRNECSDTEILSLA